MVHPMEELVENICFIIIWFSEIKPGISSDDIYNNISIVQYIPLYYQNIIIYIDERMQYMPLYLQVSIFFLEIKDLCFCRCIKYKKAIIGAPACFSFQFVKAKNAEDKATYSYSPCSNMATGIVPCVGSSIAVSNNIWIVIRQHCSRNVKCVVLGTVTL